MNALNIIKNCLFIIWSIFCLIGIATNYTHYNLLEWIVVLALMSAPFLLYALFKKQKKPNYDNYNHLFPKVSEKKDTSERVPVVAKTSKVVQANFIHQPTIGSSDLFSKIPDEVLRLLWIKGKNFFTDDEPSMINTSLLISDIITETDYTLGYYPNYKNISPAQRYIYLKWLENVKAPIDIGYVFLFYYGLERHLILGDFENAYKMIKLLRQHHANNSFQHYSSDALLISAAYHGRIDLIEDISFDSLDVPVKFYLKHKLNIPITSDELIDACRKFGFTNTRYIKENRTLFKELLEQKLYKQYGQAYLKFTDDAFSNCSKNCPLVLANYSLVKRIASMPDITSNQSVSNRIFCILSTVHEEFKAIKKANRKKPT